MPKAASVASVVKAKNKLNTFLKTLDTVPIAELEKSAQTIKAEAIAQTPYRTGKLERSVYVRVVGKRRNPTLSAGANASAGGYNYAGIQHENKAFKHPIKGKANYISDPFNKEVTNLKRRLRRRLRLKNGS